MFIAAGFHAIPAPLGAECKGKQLQHIALRWSAQHLRCKAINILLLRSTLLQSHQC